MKKRRKPVLIRSVFISKRQAGIFCQWDGDGLVRPFRRNV